MNSNLLNFFDSSAFYKAEQYAQDSQILVQTMSIFSGRRIYKHLEPSQQNDIKHFFGNYQSLQVEANRLIEKLSSEDEIKARAERYWDANKSGFLDENHSLMLHKDQLANLPVLLRAYVGFAQQLYGEPDDIDPCTHFNSGKVSLWDTTIF